MTDRTEVAWQKRQPPAMTLRCRSCRKTLGSVVDSVVGPLACLLSHGPKMKEPARKRRAIERKARGQSWEAVRPLELVMLDEDEAGRAVRCDCGRGRFVVDLTDARLAWRRRSKSADV